MKEFRKELEKFHQLLKSNKKFVFSKYADGEWLAMSGVQCEPGNGEWVIDKTHRCQYSRQLLIDSFQYKHPDYYVGISCPCCQGNAHYDMANFSGQDQNHLTYANLFVNSNYDYFVDNIIPEFSDRQVILVANKNSDITKLPFQVEDFYGVGYNAWLYDLDVIDSIEKQNYQEKTILFSCGPLGNILAHKLHISNKNNTYIDIGSTIDRWLNNDIKNKRCYAIGISSFSEKTCVWG